MTSRPETLEHTEPDSGCGVLLGLRDARVRVEVAEPDKLQLAVTWAAMHSTDTLIGPAATWEQELPIAGEGAPVGRGVLCTRARRRPGPLHRRREGLPG